MIKEKLIQFIKTSLEQRIAETLRDLASLKDSRNNDTKSSAGDKYETGREMIQIEINKLESYLEKTKQSLHELLNINNNTIFKQVGHGALVRSKTENYFISIAFGKVSIDELDYYAISKASPLAMALLGKKCAEKILFQGREIEVLQVE